MRVWLERQRALLRDRLLQGQAASLPPALQAELTRELGNYFLSFLLAGPVAAFLAIAVAVALRNLTAMFFAGVAMAGFLFVISACSAARRPQSITTLGSLEGRFVLGTVIVSVGLGGIATAVLSQPSPLIAQTVMAMLTLAMLGASNGSGPGRPQVAVAQLVVLTLPVALAMILHWPMPWGIGAGIGLLVFGVLCIAMAQRSFLTRVRMLQGREAQAAERLRLDSAVQHLAQAVAVLDGDLRVVVINRAALDLLGCDVINPAEPPLFSELLAAAPVMRTAQINRERFLDNATTLVAARQPFSAVLRLDDDRALDLDCQPIPDAGWVITLRDTSGERNAIAELNREVRRCPVTGLPNRRAFLEEVQQRLAANDRFTLLMVDLDGFKQVNDRHGHATGDRVITRVGFRLRTAEIGLFAARLGGDEFAVLLPGDSEEAAQALARKLIDTIDQPAVFGEAEVQVGAAIGIAMAPLDADALEDLLRAADLALLAAKAQPGSHVCRFTRDLKLQSARAAGIDARVRAALRAGRIDVAYQPLVDLPTGRVVAMEALARWQQDGLEDISPEELVAVAEARGLIGTLRRLVLDKAAPVVAGIDGTISLWLNASVTDLRQPGMVGEVLDELQRAGLPPQRLALEVTESALMTDEAACLANLAELIALGVGVAMDDFGSGFSSLGRLRRLPINALKISRSLLQGAPADAAAGDIFRVAADLGHSLNLMLIAEGVESRAELEMARAAGIQRVQGFGLSPPVPAILIPQAIAAAEAAARTGLPLRAAS
ncbi:MAG: hypothetical protein RIS17_963 [Pseudomonadota bacterium]|jgi:diguanylate cyclase (GGDEF)-like protein